MLEPEKEKQWESVILKYLKQASPEKISPLLEGGISPKLLLSFPPGSFAKKAGSSGHFFYSSEILF